MHGRFACFCSLLMITFLLGAAVVLANDGPTRLLRMPTVSAERIAFAYANNIWVVERDGGTARRLTSFQGRTSNFFLALESNTAEATTVINGTVSPDANRITGTLVFYDKGACPDAETGSARYQMTRIG